MNAVEEIQAAIGTLEAWREKSSPGPWKAIREDEKLAWFVDSDYGYVVSTGYLGNSDSQTHAELIAGLHGTIDAQLAILILALEYADITPNRYTDVALILALAINGGTS